MGHSTKTTLVIIGIIVLVLLLIPSLGGAFGMGGGMMGPGMMMGPGFGGWGMGFGWLWMIIIWVAIIAGVVWAIKAISGSDDSQTQHLTESALDILKKRYARGDIGREEFEDKKRELL